MKEKIRYIKIGICIVLILMSAVLMIQVYFNSGWSKPAAAQQLTFHGEYLREDGEWAALTSDVTTFASYGDLVIKGNFNRDIPQSERIFFYLNHLAMRMEVDGKECSRTPTWDNYDETLCGAYWHKMPSPGLTTENEVVLYFRNPHKLGNADAYTMLLQYMYSGSYESVLNVLMREERIWQISGVCLLLFSLALMGMALAFVQLRHSPRTKMMNFSLVTFFMGGYIILDSKAWVLRNISPTFSTYGKMLCIVLALYFFHLYIAGKVLVGFRRLMSVLWFVETLSIALIIVFTMLDLLSIYDALQFWATPQILITLIYSCCCVYELYLRKPLNYTDSIVCLLMILAILLDLVALYFGWWPVGFLAKSAYIVLFFSQIIRGNYYLAMGLRSAMRAEMLEKDLENANATIAVSQIRSHFIFNILNAISGMCKYDPAKADETIVLFARYLRANVNILNNDAPVPFTDALEYLEGYIALEQVRFGEKIHFVKEIEADDFMIPSLLMQPVAENAIKHGLLPKPKGGTIMLRTERIGKNYRITIKDDGIGFDLHAPDDPLSVGLENVRVRLHHAGGKMKIESAPGKGTTVTFTIPCKEANG